MATIAQRYESAVPIDELLEHPDNPRRGNEDVIDASMAAHGFFGAVLVQASTSRIIAGNHRTRVARRRGETTVPVLFVDVDDDQARRILLVDNRANDFAVYDDGALVELLVDLEAQGGLAGTGFDTDDLANLLAELELPEVEVDAPIEVAPAHTAPGDVWQLGRHRLICGSCREPAVFDELLAGVEIQVAVTSPPYADRRPYDPASGFRPIRPDEFVEWFAPVAANVAAHLAADGSWFVNIKAGVTPKGLDTELYVLDLVLAHVREWGWHFATEFCWERIGVPKEVSRRFKNQFEPVYQFTRGDWKIRPDNVRHWSDNVPIAGGPGVGDTSWAAGQGSGGPIFGGAKLSNTASRRQGIPAVGGALGKRKRHNGTTRTMAAVQGVAKDAGAFIQAGLAYPGNRLPTFASSHDAVGHAAAFPVGLPGLLAAEQTGRIGYGIELAASYVDMACLRWQRGTGIVPVRAGESIDFTVPES